MIAPGEIMLRLDPGEERIRCAREFKVWEGGVEYNVARGLCRGFGLKTAVCTAFADNAVGHLLEDFILPGGVDTEFIKWVPFDRVGGGDSFASGFICGLMTAGDPQQAVDYGAAHGALAMTTPGDTSMVPKNGVEKLMKGDGARVRR